jgi:dTDP-4-amino-4,6-dideoxygalactose transaminase
MYYLLMPNLERRQAFIEHLKQSGILSVFHYLPLNISEMGRKFGGSPGDCPVTERVSDCLVRLPFFSALTLSQQDEIMEVMHRLPAV